MLFVPPAWKRNGPSDAPLHISQSSVHKKQEFSGHTGAPAAAHREQHGKPEFTQAVSWMAEILDILGYLHEQHPAVVYRDLKPANLIIQEDGHLKLIDLGGAFFRCCGSP